MLSKSLSELEREKNKLTEELKRMKGKQTQQDMEIKMQIEADCREQLENSLLKEVMSVAKKRIEEGNCKPEIRELYENLKQKYGYS